MPLADLTNGCKKGSTVIAPETFARPLRRVTSADCGYRAQGHIAGDGAELLRASGRALIANPGDVDGLADAIRVLANKSNDERQVMASSGLRYYQENLSASVAAAKVVEALKGSTSD